jgi:hypothetical protein
MASYIVPPNKIADADCANKIGSISTWVGSVTVAISETTPGGIPPVHCHRDAAG